MKLSDFLDAGSMVLNSVFDGVVSNLSDMSEQSQRRHGYTEPDGSWTDRGYDRATSVDYERLETANRVIKKMQGK